MFRLVILYLLFKRSLQVVNYRFVFKKSSSSQGQAIVEYILLIVVSITLVIGVATKLITPLRDFMQNYAGAYVECLLETGDLPSFLTTNPNSECTIEKMKAVGLLDSTSGGSGGSGGGGSGGQTSGNSNASNSNRSNGSSNTNGGSGSGSGSGSSSGSSRGPQPSQGSNTGADSGNETGSSSSSSSAGGAGEDKDAKKSNSLSSGDSSDSGGLKTYQNDYGSGITGVVSVPKEMQQNGLQSGSSQMVKSGQSQVDELRQSSFSAPFNEKPEPKKGLDLESGMGFNWGMYLRYFIIGGIILALIIMVGTQLNSLRKSWTSSN